MVTVGRGRHAARRRRRRRRPSSGSPPPPPVPPPEPPPAPPPAPPVNPSPSTSRLDPTGALVAVLWERDGAVELGSWTPPQSELAGLGGRHRRRGLLVVPLLAILLAAGAWWYVGERSRRAEARSATEVVAAASNLADVAAGLAPQVSQLALIQADPRRRADLVTGLATLDSASRRLFDAASALPSDFEGDGRIRLRASDLARRGFSAEQTASEALTVAAALTPVTVRPDLPPSVPAESVPDLAADLAWWITQVQNTAPDLGSDPRWASLGATFDDLLAVLTPFQERYLGAVRTGDSETAASTVADVDEALRRVEATLSDTLARLGADTAAELAEIASLSRDLAQGER